MQPVVVNLEDEDDEFMRIAKERERERALGGEITGVEIQEKQKLESSSGATVPASCPEHSEGADDNWQRRLLLKFSSQVFRVLIKSIPATAKVRSERAFQLFKERLTANRTRKQLLYATSCHWRRTCGSYRNVRPSLRG